MQSTQQPSIKQEKDVQQLDNSVLLVQLLQLGFDQTLITQSLKHTNNKQKAVEIILRFGQLGLNTDISDIVPSKLKTQLLTIPFKSPGFKYKMIFLVNMQLKMGKGKICAQVAHACLFAYIQLHDEARFDKYKEEVLNGWQTLGCAKIVVRVDSTKQLIKFKEMIDKAKINTFLVEDAGKTQIKQGSMTVLGVGPVESEIIDPITQELKLL